MDRLGKPVKDYAKNREVNKKKKLKFMKDVGESLQRLIKNASSDPDKFSKTFKKSDNVKFKHTPKGWGKY